MNKIDRYKILIRYSIEKGIAANQKDLGRKLGYNNESSFSQIINGKVNEPKDFIAKLTGLIPDLNSEWILLGEGDMLKNSENRKESHLSQDKFQQSILNAISAVEKIAESNRILAESNHDLTTTNKILATSNTDLVQKLAGLLEEIRVMRSGDKYDNIHETKGQFASDVERPYVSSDEK